jgi:hypothetical protein
MELPASCYAICAWKIKARFASPVNGSRPCPDKKAILGSPPPAQIE